jgi:hypothetical protein
MGNRDKMLRVSSAQPCPVCVKPDWCLIAPDGTAAICKRVESGKECGEAGWLHQLSEPIADLSRWRPNPVPPKLDHDWNALAHEYAEALTADHRAKLAAALRLPTAALDGLDLIGWLEKESAWIFPERDGNGKVVGLTRRYENGEKKMIQGGQRGLTIPRDWREKVGPLFLVEGPSDVLAMTFCGLAAIGRPSNRGGVKRLAVLLRDYLDVVIVVGEQDRKKNGNWPGLEGASAVAATLANMLGRPVLWAMPPDGIKDVRQWVIDLADRCCGN